MALAAAGTVRGAGSRIRTVEELTQEAEVVALGQVSSIESLRDRTGHPFTRVEFKTAEIWKGTSPSTLRLVSASAVLGERWVQVVGEEPFRLGEDLVVFTRRNPEGNAVMIDPAQGRFRVHRDRTNEVRHVENGLIGETPAAAAAAVRTPMQRRLTLTEFRDRVRQAAIATSASTP
jgi:hypothetical protein